MKMKTFLKSLSLLVTILFLGACAVATASPQAAEVAAPAAAAATYTPRAVAEVTSTPLPISIPQVSTQFTSILNPGAWTKEIIGSSSLDGGYVVDITPLNPADPGSYVEQKIIPEFDGEQWKDVLWMSLSVATKPIKVRVQVFSTMDWPIAFDGLLALNPGELHDFVIGDATLNGGYAVEIDPLEAGISGDTFEQALVLPKFSGDWYDVLRIQIPASQSALSVNARVYRTPDDLPVQAEFTVHLKPDDWVGFVLGDSNDRCAFIMEVTPLVDEDNQIIFRVQQEYDGKGWKDIARLEVPFEFPATDVLLRIYSIR